MNHLEGVTIDVLQSPLFSLNKVRDLIYFEGPILSHYISEDNLENWLSLWVDTDANSNRWLLFEITRVTLRQYLESDIPLLHLLKRPKSKIVFIYDIDKHLEATRQITVVTPDSLPEEYLPAEDSFFDYDLAPFDEYVTYGMVDLDGDWSLFDLSSFTSLFNKVYAFAYTLTHQTVYDVISEYPWRGGYSQIGFFNRIQKAVGTPPIKAIRYASPGYLSLEVDQPSEKNLENSLLGYIQNKREIESMYDEVLDFVREQNLNANPVLQNQVISNLDAVQIERLDAWLVSLSDHLNMRSLLPEQKRADGRVFGRVKAFMAYIRLLENLEVFHKSGLAQLTFVKNVLEKTELIRPEPANEQTEDLPF